ncbi:MAG: tRNA pseudouridine(13) synthase TruD [Euryarchaeota archaeon]|nr:tRNA pseudouridine(13) synthase TruD [Euryarchaeota archaeon]
MVANCACSGEGFPKNLLKMFIHAYQSVIFNKILSARIK